MAVVKITKHPIVETDQVHQPFSVSSSCISNLFKVYFDFTYYLGLSPFRLKFQRGQYIAYSWLPQKLISSLYPILVLFWLIRGVRLRIPTKANSNPNAFLNLSFVVFAAFARSMALKKYWLNGKDFARICTYIHEHGGLYCPKNCSKISIKNQIFAWIAILTGIFLSVVLVQVSLGFGVHSGAGGALNSSGIWDTAWGKMVQAGRYNFFLDDIIAPVNASQTEFEATDHIIGILAAIGYMPRRLLSLYCQLLLLVSVLTVWAETKNLEELLKVTSNTDAVDETLFGRKIVEFTGPQAPPTKFQYGVRHKRNVVWTTLRAKFNTIGKLAGLLNSLLGHNMSLFIVESLVYYTTNLEEFVIVGGSKVQNFPRIVVMLVFFVNFCTILPLAADVPKKMKSLKRWLAVDENRKDVPIELMVLLLSDIDGNSISVRASGVFSITYSTLASLLGISITYFMICIST